MNPSDLFGGNLRQPEATLKPRLPHFSGYNINDLRKSEATEATFLKVSHVREGGNCVYPIIIGVAKKTPQLPHLSGSDCGRGNKPEATSECRLPQVASKGAVWG